MAVEMKRVVVEYRTESIEAMGMPDYWYEGDNQESYGSVDEALSFSDVVKDYRSGRPCSLTVVRLVEEGTRNVVRYVGAYAAEV